MANKPEETVINKDACVHYWMIETGSHGKAPGTCKKCGELRIFSTKIPEIRWNQKLNFR